MNTDPFVLGVDLDGVCGAYTDGVPGGRRGGAARAGRVARPAALLGVRRVGCAPRGVRPLPPARRARAPHLQDDGTDRRRGRGAVAALRRRRVDPDHHPPAVRELGPRDRGGRHRRVARPERHPLPRHLLPRPQARGRGRRVRRRRPSQRDRPPRGTATRSWCSTRPTTATSKDHAPSAGRRSRRGGRVGRRRLGRPLQAQFPGMDDPGRRLDHRLRRSDESGAAPSSNSP